jgi:hypothetical protein
MSEAVQKKNGDIIFLCDCGLSHKLVYDDANEEITVETKFVKPKEEKEKNEKDKKPPIEKRKSFFTRG